MKFRPIFNFLTVLLLFLVSATVCLARQPIDSNWYPFTLTDKLFDKSAANIGSLVLEAPSGQHGFVRVKNDSFYFENGKKIRFWGTNISGSACFPDKKQAEQIAANLAFWGFNALRLSRLDSDFAPNGIFEDIGSEYNDPQLKTTAYLSEEQLDKLDYFIYQLKQKGIYVYLELFSDRKFTQADGIVDAEFLNGMSDAACVFDEELIALQKEYAKKILNRENKYTGLKYNQEPAIALIAISRKSSLLEAWKKNILNGNLFGIKKQALPGYYAKQLDYLWNESLRDKYGSLENLRKAWKGKTSAPAKTTLNKVTWKIEETNNAKALLAFKDQSAKIRIKKTTKQPKDIQFRANYLNLLSSKKYLLRFSISANQKTPVDIVAEQVFSPWKNLGLEQTIIADKTPQIITIPFSPVIDCDNAKVSFIIGHSKATIDLSYVELKEIDSLPIIDNESKLTRFKFHRPLYRLIKLYPEQAQKDIVEFYSGLTRQYLKNMKDFLVTQCNVKVPVTGMSSYSTSEDVLSQADCDFIAASAFWDYPVFADDIKNKTNFTINNNSTIQEQDLGILGRIKQRSPNTTEEKNTPFVVSEWNHSFPNQFAYESPTLLGSVAGINGWDGLFQYCYQSSTVSDKSPKQISDFFEIANNPQQLILCAVAALAFDYEFESPKIKGLCGFMNNKVLDAGPITAVPHNDGAVFVLSLEKKPVDQSKHFLLVALSEVKNSDSRWEKGVFNWGNEPVLLKHIDVDIQIKKEHNPTVYTLDNKGMRHKKLKLDRENDLLRFNTGDIESPWFEIILK